MESSLQKPRVFVSVDKRARKRQDRYMARLVGWLLLRCYVKHDNKQALTHHRCQLYSLWKCLPYEAMLMMRAVLLASVLRATELALRGVCSTVR